MPAIQCPECGKSLLAPDSNRSENDCLCSNCGRKVYARLTVKAKVKCPKCNAINEKVATV